VSVAGIGKKIKASNILIGKSEARTLLGRPRRTREDHYKTDLKDIRREVMGWINLAQDTDQWPTPVNTARNLRAP
jgi:hypothetical protein